MTKPREEQLFLARTGTSLSWPGCGTTQFSAGTVALARSWPPSPRVRPRFCLDSQGSCISNWSLASHILTALIMEAWRTSWNVGKLLPVYTSLQTRRQPSSYSSPWEPKILFSMNLSPVACNWVCLLSSDNIQQFNLTANLTGCTKEQNNLW
jgi:hypothetical protein